MDRFTQSNPFLSGYEAAMKEITIGDTHEQCIERSDYPPEKVRQVLGSEIVAVLGYGVQGRGQSLNMRDNGVRVIVGQRKGGKAYDLCLEDGWVPGETLFDPEEAAARGTVIQYLLSDAGQKEMWPRIKPHLTAGKALYFSHGFSIVFSEQTGVIAPPGVDVILCAPKGSGTTVRRLFLEGRGINSSFAIHQDATGRARERCLALGVAIGSGYLFETTFKKEVVSDLTGERGVLARFNEWVRGVTLSLANRRRQSPGELIRTRRRQSPGELIRTRRLSLHVSHCGLMRRRQVSWVATSL
jgi:ketol-acid reductoisomerase